MKILIFSIAFSACARVVPPAPRPVLVNIPIATPIYCDVPALQPPALAIASLTADSPPADTVRDYAATVDVLKSAVRERDAILRGCEAPQEPGPRPLPPVEGEQKTDENRMAIQNPVADPPILSSFSLAKGLGVRFFAFLNRVIK